jgi:hypothetical protein
LATAKSRNPAAPARKSFALVGPSRHLDPTRYAVRGDIADVRLAEHVFAPHYAAPLPRVLSGETSLRESRATDSATLATLAKGETFEVLDVTGAQAWGIAPAHRLVGYIDEASLEPSA